MGVRLDYASSILLCAEDNSSILDFNDDDDVENDDNEDLGHDGVKERGKGLIFEQRCDFFGDCLMGFEVQSEESFRVMIKRECQLLPRIGYAKRFMDGDLDISIRRDAIDWITKVHAQYSFRPLTAYLSVNYLDRFLSAYELPKGKAWMTQLLSVACLSLAAKMEETEVPLIIDLQVGEAKYIFESKTIQRMELLILSTLKWRMQAVTPFSFIDYFLNKFNDQNFRMMSLVSRAVGLIQMSIRGIDLLQFRPSEVAAAVALVSLREIQVVDVDKILTGSIFVEKERVLRCYEMIQEMALMNMNPPEDSIPSASSVPLSPIGVLDAASLSYGSDDITTVASLPGSENTSPAAKKRKL